MKSTPYDILVIGSGIGGLFYAIKCAPFARVLIITKGFIGESNTMYAQGGIAAVFDTKDSVASHINDTLNAGDGLCNLEAVEVLVENARNCVLELEQLNVHFDKTALHNFDLHREGGHSFARVVHHDDATGKELENSLVKAVRSNINITILEHQFVIDLLVDGGKCNGAIILDQENNEAKILLSKITMLASGGAGQVYMQNTNPVIATGDGFAMAYRAGAEMMGMEFVQFHPTVLYSPGNENFLITEAVRGFGAELKHKNGETFMEKYHPMKSLAPRDIVSLAITEELKRTNDTCVYLDLRSFDQSEVKKHFPNVYKRCQDEGLDLSREMIPVIPAAHFMCGGVKTDLQGRTSIVNLYCCGECSCTGVHGANRLASNSLLEGLVFATQAAKNTEKILPEVNIPVLNVPLKPNIAEETETEEMARMKKYLQNMMWCKVGIIRNFVELENCLVELDTMKSIAEWKIKRNGISKEWMELLNMIETSKMIAYSAELRTESRGCHYRSDYPDKKPIMPNSLISKDEFENCEL